MAEQTLRHVPRDDVRQVASNDTVEQSILFATIRLAGSIVHERQPVVLAEKVERFCFADVGEGRGERVDLGSRVVVGFAGVEVTVRIGGSESLDLVTEAGCHFEDDRFAVG